MNYKSLARIKNNADIKSHRLPQLSYWACYTKKTSATHRSKMASSEEVAWASPALGTLWT